MPLDMAWVHRYEMDRAIQLTKIWMWLWQNASFGGLWCETELLCVRSLPQIWPRRPNFLLLTNINGYRACLFPVVGDLNGHHQEWLGPTTTNRHGVAAFDFATVSGCDHLAVGPTHARGGTLDLLMTDVPDLLRVAAVAPVGNADQSLCRCRFRWLKLFHTCEFVGEFP